MSNDLDKNKKVPNVPNLRFRNFNGSWKTLRLKNISLIYDGTHQTPDYKNDGIKFVSVEDISNLYASKKYISEDAFKTEFKNKPILNDILMTRIGDIGTPAIVSGLEPLAYYVSLALIKPINVNYLFLKYLIESQSFQHELWKRTIHVAFPKKINKKEIGECLGAVPGNDEQIKIGVLMSKIDERIQTQNKIIEDLFLLKKSITHDVFNKPSSEKNKLCNLIDISTGKRDANESDERGIYPFFTCGKETLKINKYSFEGESLLISGNGEIGQVKYYSGKFDAYQRTYVLQNSKSPILYLKAYLQFILPMIVEREKQQSAMPYIVLATLKNIDVPILDINKTDIIISTFKAIDKKIERENKYKELLNKEKRYLLRNLFI